MYLSDVGGSTAASNIYIVVMLIAEGSNPFMMTRSIMRSKGLKETKMYMIIEVCFAFSFLYLRAVVFTFVLYNAWASVMPFAAKIILSVTYSVGLFWIFIILNTIAKRLPEYSFVRNFTVRILTLISKNPIPSGLMIFVWAIIVPYFLTQMLHLGFLNIHTDNFVVL